MRCSLAQHLRTFLIVRSGSAGDRRATREQAKTLTLRRHFRARATTHVNGARIVLHVRNR
ncbi:hypothetical protein LUX34_32430 [Streptomyces werraensis]|uniref:hypothetical protein n=1 Tax=Streptomyces sp. enrichment culture TaxID=1795815 RepID=UPI003F56C0E8|nr:hypothetical protein [Streptomyces werraensis]